MYGQLWNNITTIRGDGLLEHNGEAQFSGAVVLTPRVSRDMMQVHGTTTLAVKGDALTAEDLTLVAMEIPGALTDTTAAIGQEARVMIYAGRPIRQTDLGPGAVIERNQIIPLSYAAGGLSILTEGRALARGGVGDVIEVMNLSSRIKVSGQIGPDGVVRVGPPS